MAGYQVLNAPTVGVSQGFGRGMDNVQSMMNVYAQAMMKDKFDQKKQAAKNKEMDAVWNDPQYQKGFKKKMTMGPEGRSITIEQDVPDPDQDLKRVIAGYGSPDEQKRIGDRVGVKPPPVEVPGMSMIDGSVGNIPNPDGTDYGDAIRRYLMPDYTKQDAVADRVGLPSLKETDHDKEKVDFDINEVYKKSGGKDGDSDDFLAGLVELSAKYPGNKAIHQLMSEQMQLKRANKGKADAFSGEGWK